MPYTRDDDIVLDFDIWLDGPLTPERVREEVARMMDEVVEEMADQRRRVAAAATPFIPRQEPPPPDVPPYPIWQHTPYDPPGSGGQDTPPAWRPRLYAPPSQPAEVVQPRPWQVGGHSFYFEEPGDVERVLAEIGGLPSPALYTLDRDIALEDMQAIVTDLGSTSRGQCFYGGTTCVQKANEILSAAGLPETEARQWPPTDAWRFVSALYTYLTENIIPSPREVFIPAGSNEDYRQRLDRLDPIFVLDGPTLDASSMVHVMIIVDFDSNGLPMVLDGGNIEAKILWGDDPDYYGNLCAYHSEVFIEQVRENYFNEYDIELSLEDLGESHLYNRGYEEHNMVAVHLPTHFNLRDD